MKIVGIVGRSKKDNNGSCEFECLESYSRVFSNYDDVIPIMILPPKGFVYYDMKSSEECVVDNDKLRKLDAVLDMCDGFLVPGGSKWFSHDEYVIKYAIDKDKPLLGICLGMQIMGVMDNRQNNGEFDTTIKNGTNINHQQKDVKYVHGVEVVKNTLLHSILGLEKFKVNSRHFYHIGGVVNLNIDAVSEDGLIEALSYPGKKFILGVQWHPESLFEEDVNSKKIFDSFVSKL